MQWKIKKGRNFLTSKTIELLNNGSPWFYYGKFHSSKALHFIYISFNHSNNNIVRNICLHSKVATAIIMAKIFYT